MVLCVDEAGEAMDRENGRKRRRDEFGTRDRSAQGEKARSAKRKAKEKRKRRGRPCRFLPPSQYPRFSRRAHWG